MSRCKYAMRQHQISYDEGVSWNILETIKGELIEEHSSDCPDSGSEITKWVTLEGDYICEDKNKYKKQVLYVSYDEGVSWYIYFPTVYQKGEFVGVDESFCNNKFEGHYILEEAHLGIDPLKVVKCDDNTELTGADTLYYNYSTVIGQTKIYINGSLISGKIGDCVTSIGIGAFQNYSGLTSITIPSGVTSIGYGAFENCKGLSSITIPNSVTSIGNDAFKGCSSLPIENGIRYADIYLVEVVDKTQTTYTIKDGTKFINTAAFVNCNSLTSITIPNSVTSIGDRAFTYCTSLSSITMPDSVVDVGINVFKYCGQLPIEGNIRYADTCIASAIPNYSNYTIKEGTRLICGESFSGCTNLTSIAIPNSVVCIGDGTFKGCSGLTSVSMPSGITKIYPNTFYQCRNLQNLTIPSGVTSIGNNAFFGCRSLGNITIPSGVTYIGDGAFYGCSSSNIIVLAETPPTLSSNNAFMYVSGTIYVPAASLEAYRSAPNWSVYASQIQALP